jgi:ribosome maturation factor RimP
VGRLPTFCFWGSFTQLIDRIRAIAERVAGSYGLDIFDVQFRRESSGWVLRIFVDVPDTDEAPAAADASVTVDDCANVSRDVSAILDVEETIDHHFILEVSSPGLDRPLRRERDYRRFAGRLAKIVVAEAVDNQKHFAGRLRGLEQDAVVIETRPGKRQLIPLSLITRARLDVEF